MHRTSSRFAGRLLLLAVAAGLAACGGGGGAGAGPAPGPTLVLSSTASPGRVVALQASGSGLEPASTTYQWRQVAGLPVNLRDTGSVRASFVMPPLAPDATLSFSVDLRRADGTSSRERHEVRGDEDRRAGPPPAVVAGDFVVFRATKDLAQRTDLYLARLDGSAVFRLNAPLPPGGFVSNFAISPDHRSVAYQNCPDWMNCVLVVAATDGSGTTTAPGTPHMDVGSSLTWSPDSSMVAFVGRELPTGPQELFAGRRDGTGITRVSGPLVLGGGVWSFTWAPNGSRLAYVADQYTNGVTELFSSRPDGSSNARVSAPLVPGGSVYAYGAFYAWAPDGSRIAYFASQETAHVPEIFTARPDGSGNVKVSLPLGAGGAVGAPSWAPDGSRIAYLARQDANQSLNLISVAPDGSLATYVAAMPYRSNVAEFLWAPNSRRIAYRAYDETYVNSLFAAGPGGEATASLFKAADNSSSGIYSFTWAPDSSRLAYVARASSAHPPAMFSTLPDGTGTAEIAGPMVTGGGLASYSALWAPDSSRIGYVATQVSPTAVELFTSKGDGTGNVRVSGAQVNGGGVQGFLWATDSTRLVYRADQLVNDQYELFVAAPDGGAVNARISGPLTDGGDVYDFLLP
jgi:Tol biopolymer transport system component